MITTRNDEKQRYELTDGDKLVGFATFHTTDGVTTIPHTEIAPAYGGNGHGSTLVRATLDDLRARGETVVPQCPFVASWIQRHPDYQDLVAS